MEEKLKILWKNYENSFNETLRKIISRGFCYTDIQTQNDILVTGINPSFRINDEGNQEFCVSFDYQRKKQEEKDRYFKSIDNLFVDEEDKKKVTYIDIFNFKHTDQKEIISLFCREKENKGICFLAENLAITQIQIETIIKPKLIIVRNKGSWDFWGLNAKQDNDSNVWMGYKFDKIKEFSDCDIPCGQVRKISGLIDSGQRVNFDNLKKTNLEGTIVLFTNHFQYCRKEQRPKPELIKDLYNMAINNKYK